MRDGGPEPTPLVVTVVPVRGQGAAGGLVARHWVLGDGGQLADDETEAVLRGLLARLHHLQGAGHYGSYCASDAAKLKKYNIVKKLRLV